MSAKRPTNDYALRARAPKETQLDQAETGGTPVNPVKGKKRMEKVNLDKSLQEIVVDRISPANPKSPYVNSVTKVPPKSGVSRLDLPNIYGLFKAEPVKFNPNRDVDKLKSAKTRADTMKLADVSDMMINVTLSETETKRKLRHDYNLDEGIQSQLEQFLKTQKKEPANERKISSPSFIQSPHSHYHPSPHLVNGDSIKESPRNLLNIDVEPVKKLNDLMKIAADVLSTSSTLSKSLHKNARSKTSRKNSISQIASVLNIESKRLKEFRIYTDATSLLESYRQEYSACTIPDTFKQFAFTMWQAGDYEKCVYYLSEAHGVFLRSEIVDKHNLYLCRYDEFVPARQMAFDPKLEKVKLEKFKQHSTDVLAFGKSYASFYKHLDVLDSDWNIIQLTTMFSVQNRFSSDTSAETSTPALFLTCFSSFPGSYKKHPFVCYIPEPKIEKGVSPLGIIGDFKKIMLGNRTINEKFTGSRKEYWSIRDEHNSQLKSCLNAVQENWLSPWYFLLPGNVIDIEIRKKIYNYVRAVEFALNKTLTAHQRLAFFKLVENYSVLSEQLRRVLPDLISYILDVPKSKVNRISQKLIKIGSLVTETAPRHPTVLIIDQAIEQLPWDWLPCLRGTTVTRVQSLPIMYSLMNLAADIEPVNPSSCLFVLNPDLSLKNVQTRLQKYFEDRKSWIGYTAKKPHVSELEELFQIKDMFLYCGHGSGQYLFPDYVLQKVFCRAIPVLMGCGSAQYEYHGPRTYSSSVVNSYFVAACPSIVGFLWEITDVECDRITVELLEHWSPGGSEIPTMTGFDSKTKRPETDCLATAARLARKAATQFLTSAGVVNYGVPVKRTKIKTRAARNC